MNIGIIIQIRTGATRLPNKVLLPFYESDLLVDVFFQKFHEIKNKYPVIVATTTNPKDDVLVEYANKYGLISYRGSEEDVLQRFIEAASKNNIGVIIRVCGDNPFLSIDYIENLIEEHKRCDTFDYISYQDKNELPTIRTHYGFFSELVKLPTLEKIAMLTGEKFYHEHVTNYIYNHKQDYKIGFLKIPFEENSKVRLTVDTIEDFSIAKQVYKWFRDTNTSITPENVMEYLTKNTDMLDSMNEQIQQQIK